MRKPSSLALVAPAVALALAACGQAPNAAPGATTSAITVAETKAVTGPIASVFSYTGSVAPTWTVSVIPETSGPIVQLNIKQGQHVQPGQVLAVIDHRSLDDQVTQEKANLAAAQAKLQSLESGARPEDITAAKANVAAAAAKLNEAQQGGSPQSIGEAQAKLAADQANLSKLLAGPAPEDVTNAQLAVAAAKDNLFAQQTQYDRQVAEGIASPSQRQAALDVAQTQIDQANTQLAKLTAPPRPEDVAAAKAAVDADTQALAQAKQPNRPQDITQLQQALIAQQAQAAKAAAPYTTSDIAQAQAAVQVAQASLQSAQTALSNASVAAPAAGIISDVPVAVGSVVGPATPIATLISANLEVDASVDESQVAQFKDGQSAQISAGQASAKPLGGTVAVVAPAADPKTRKFTVRVVPAAPSTTLLAGMSATVNIQTGQVSSALLVPKDAVLQRNGQQVVFVDQGGRARMEQVRTGVSNSQDVQILSGLSSGAQVILPGSVELADGDAVLPAPAGPGPAPSTSAASSGASAQASVSSQASAGSK